MKKFLLALALFLLPSIAFAQCNGIFPNNTVCGNITGANNTPRPTNPSAFLGAAGGTNGQIQYNNAGALGGFTMSQDCTTNTSTGTITCTKTNNVPFTSAATTNIGTSGATIPLNNGNNTFSGNDTFSGNNTHSGTNIFSGGTNTFNNTTQIQGPSYFGFGYPWIDVRSNANSCAAAVGDGSTDDTTALQCHINYMSSTFGGGIVYFPPGNYRVANGGITVPKAVWLIGAVASNVAVSTISVTTDSKVVSFQITGTTCPGGHHSGGMEKLSIQGYNNAAATQDTVWIGDNCNVTIRDSIIWFGANALKNRGVDSYIESSFIWGYTSALTSNGANWYQRVKFDDPIGHASTYGYLQGQNISGLTTAENTFVMCDFSGTYTDSVLISDTNNSSVTKFIGSIFSAPFVVTNARFVQISAGEFGSATFTVSAGTLVMSSSVGLTSITITGAGSRVCAANAAITC